MTTIIGNLDFLSAPTLRIRRPSRRRFRRSKVEINATVHDMIADGLEFVIDSDHLLHLGEKVHIMIGESATAAVVIGMQSNPLTEDNRYRLRVDTVRFARASDLQLLVDGREPDEPYVDTNEEIILDTA